MAIIIKISYYSKKLNFFVLIVFEKLLDFFFSEQQSILVHSIKILLLILRNANSIIVALLQVRHKGTLYFFTFQSPPVYVFQPWMILNLFYPIRSQPLLLFPANHFVYEVCGLRVPALWNLMSFDCCFI